jgi:vacuolar-type H+-ATPase subunit I/STV1
VGPTVLSALFFFIPCIFLFTSSLSTDQAKDEVKRNIQGIKKKRADKTVGPTRKRQRKQLKKVKNVSKKTMRKAPRKGSAVKPLNILKKNKKPRRKQANQTNTLKQTEILN